jgi:hypothetical protein
MGLIDTYVLRGRTESTNLMLIRQSYSPSTIFALDPSVDLGDMREGHRTGGLNRDRIAWLGLAWLCLAWMENPYMRSGVPITYISNTLSIQNLNLI